MKTAKTLIPLRDYPKGLFMHDDTFEEMQVLLMLRMGVNEVIAELKKKYTEEQT